MTPKEFQAALAMLAKSIGQRATVSVNISSQDNHVLWSAIYPIGISGNSAVTTFADTFEDLLDILKGKWAEYLFSHERETIRRLALEVIRITADHGHCGEAALRLAGFEQEDIVRYADAACADANTIVANGPFVIDHSPNQGEST